MNKGACILCGAFLAITVSLTEGAPSFCHDCEEKKQLHIEVSQPTGMVQQATTTTVSGISSSLSISPSPSSIQDEVV